MDEITIKNRKEEESKFFMVQLFIDDTEIPTGDDPFECHFFWDQMNKQSERALYRIETNNPDLGFDYNLMTMGLSTEEKREKYLQHIKLKFPNLDVVKINNLIEEEIGKIKLSGPDDNHPNPRMKFPLDSDLTKMLVMAVINELNKE